jgi:hypothetical protein
MRRPAAGDACAITVLFADIEGSSGLLERFGDRAWPALINRHGAFRRADRRSSRAHRRARRRGEMRCPRPWRRPLAGTSSARRVPGRGRCTACVGPARSTQWTGVPRSPFPEAVDQRGDAHVQPLGRRRARTAGSRAGLRRRAAGRPRQPGRRGGSPAVRRRRGDLPRGRPRLRRALRQRASSGASWCTWPSTGRSGLGIELCGTGGREVGQSTSTVEFNR